MTQVKVNAYSAVHNATYVATSMLRGLKQIIVESGLDPSQLSDGWTVLETGVAAWLRSGHLRSLSLEIWDSAKSANLLRRFDFDIDYSYSSDASGALWLDPRTVRQAILKAGTVAGRCGYRLVVSHSPGAPSVEGFSPTEYRSTVGMTRHSVGTAVTGGVLGAGLSFWALSS